MFLAGQLFEDANSSEEIADERLSAIVWRAGQLPRTGRKYPPGTKRRNLDDRETTSIRTWYNYTLPEKQFKELIPITPYYLGCAVGITLQEIGKIATNCSTLGKTRTEQVFAVLPEKQPTPYAVLDGLIMRCSPRFYELSEDLGEQRVGEIGAALRT